ncbi:MAG: phosphate/phosphite/phosphonate ABC transporter substrate-binding protein [Blastocatellia bacterium]|nr:phosphate/phosphite/phosphonate ABC transporter substrate-binding protein [Blastocatellia bacterium]
MKSTILPLLLFLCAFILAGCEPGAAENAGRPSAASQKLVVALKPDKNPDQMMEERQSLSKYLSEKLGREVEVVIPVSAAVINEGFSNGTVDIGYLSANDLINSKDAELLLVGEINGQTTYKSYWLALKDSPYDSVEDLKGKPIAFASKTSTSGFVIPLWDLKRRNLLGDGNDPEAFFGKGNVFYGTGYLSAVERVLNGQAEAAAVSYYVLDEDKHLSEEQRGRLKKIQEQGDVPTHIIAIRSSIPAAERAALKQALLELNDGANTGLRDRVVTSKLVEAEQEAHLRPLKDALSVLPK